jgi:3-hexulose-6-phosphate synthase
MNTTTATASQSASARLVEMLRSRFTFQISVDVDNIPLGLKVAEAALAAGVDVVELGTPLCKTAGTSNAIPAFRAQFPDALLLADMKSMDGAGYEARAVYGFGGNIIDFLALAGVDSARAVCAARDEVRARDAGEVANPMARLAFADILVPQQGPADIAVEVAERMVEAGVDGVGLHLQLDARRADPSLYRSSYLSDVARAVHAKVGDRVSVQVVGGLNLAQAKALAVDGLRAFVISGNMGIDDAEARYGAPAEEITRLCRAFIAEVSAAA